MVFPFFTQLDFPQASPDDAKEGADARSRTEFEIGLVSVTDWWIPDINFL